MGRNHDTHHERHEKPFPFLAYVSLVLPFGCALIVMTLALLGSNFLIPAAFFSIFVAVAGILISIASLCFKERPIKLAMIGIAANCLVIYGVTFVPMH